MRDYWPDGLPPGWADAPAAMPFSGERWSALQKAGLALLVAILVLHGTYLRSRDNESTGVDLVVLGRIAACAGGLGIGVLMIRKALPLGFGAKMTLLYGLAAVLSAMSCPYATMVVGYSILLVGSCLLIIVLVNSARSISQLRFIEGLWFWTVSLLIVKDTFIVRTGAASEGGTDVSRLGMGSTHPCELSLLAVLAFWMSWGHGRGWMKAGLWLFRGFLIYVLIAAETRTSIAAFVLVGMVRYLLTAADPLRRIVVGVAAAGAMSTFILLNLYSSDAWAADMMKYLKRGQDAKQLSSFTGRTEIWNQATSKMWETPVFGHGYAVTRFTLGRPRDAGFQPMHCHNMLLEVFFGTGFAGLIPFVAMLLYNLRWLAGSARWQRIFSADLALNAACSVLAILATSLFESRLAVRLTLFNPLFCFYLVALDRARYFHGLRLRQEGRIHDGRELVCAGHGCAQ